MDSGTWEAVLSARAKLDAAVARRDEMLARHAPTRAKLQAQQDRLSKERTFCMMMAGASILFGPAIIILASYLRLGG